MKKSLLAFAVLGAFAGVAAAQSSVTLFGVVDVNARYVKNGDVDVKSLSSGGLNSSRLGFRGVEDLGGGLKAGFWIEHRFNADDGNLTSSRFWHGRSTASLMGGFGEVRLGRDFTPTYTGFTAYDPFGDSGVAGINKFNPVLTGSSAQTTVRSDNMISYFTPAMGGFYGQLSYAPSEGVVGGKYIGGRVGYAAGPIDVSGSYGTTEGVAGEDYEKGSLGASYNLGVVKLSGFISQAKYAALKLATIEIGAAVPVGAGTIKAAVARANASGGGTDANDANQIAVGYVHDLSKRTALYGTYARVSNKGLANFTVATPPVAVAGARSQGLEFGVRHSF